MTQPGSHSQPPGVSTDEDRRKHIDLIQATVTRMASASSTSKSWLLPVATATLGYALTKGHAPVAALGVGAVVLFCVLDAHYLRQERAFRALFRAAVDRQVALYEMNSNVYFTEPATSAPDLRVDQCNWKKVFWSWSIAGFYLPIIIVGIATYVWAAFIRP